MQAYMSRGAAAYQQTQVQSRSPLELVVLLYDGALRFIAAARDANNRHDRKARGEAVSRVLAIIGHLHSSLDLDAGGEIATRLDALYAYSTARLVDVTLRSDGTALDEVENLLRPLRDAWAEVSAAPPAASVR